MQEKDYRKWMEVKSALQHKTTLDSQPFVYREGQVLWMSIGENVGYEEDGKGVLFNRPVLVIKSLGRHLFYGVPLTTKYKNHIFYQPIEVNGKLSFAMIHQTRPYDAARINGNRAFGAISGKDLRRIRRAFTDLILS